jgi:hypothetical protein
MRLSVLRHILNTLKDAGTCVLLKHRHLYQDGWVNRAPLALRRPSINLWLQLTKNKPDNLFMYNIYRLWFICEKRHFFINSQVFVVPVMSE